MGSPQIDALKARAASLGFKKATQGLTPQEEVELSQIERQLAMQKAGFGGSQQGGS